MILDKQIELTNLKTVNWLNEVEMRDGLVYQFYYSVFKQKELWKLSINLSLYIPDNAYTQDFNVVKTINSLDDIDRVIKSFKEFIKELQK